MIIDKNTPHFLMLEKTLSSKKFSLQFLPERLHYISKSNKIFFKEKNLKTSYIIDIVHNMILKYYFKKDNSFTLNSVILKEKYGHLYNYYIDWLLENEIIRMKRNYSVGNTSRVYSLNSNIISGKILRWKNKDNILIKKYVNRYYQYEIDNNDIISKEIKDKLILDLYSVTIQYDRSIFYLDSLKSEKNDIYNRNRYSVESISDKHIFFHFDHYGRMHSNFTILKSFIRKNCLLIDGEETCEIDIPNSQPMFLVKLIKDIESNWVREEEFRIFSNLVMNGNFYIYLVDKLNLKDKSEAKEMTYKVLFGKNNANSKYDKKFIELFPSIHHFIKLYKKQHNDYKILSHTLQRMESDMIFNEVIRTLMIINPDIKTITVHDSIIIQKKYRDIVQSIFESKMKECFNFNI
jgi:hypothetical protein